MNSYPDDLVVEIPIILLFDYSLSKIAESRAVTLPQKAPCLVSICLKILKSFSEQLSYKATAIQNNLNVAA